MFPLQTTAPTRSPPLVTWGLITANCAIFLFQISLGPEELEHFLYQFALIPARYFAPLPFKDFVGTPFDYLPFVSNMFLHGGWLHLILNMWTLWLFGPAVEDRLGTVRYIVFYICCGAVASYAHAAFNPLSTIPALGASGAIAGVLAGFLLLYPLARLVILVPSSSCPCSSRCRPLSTSDSGSSSSSYRARRRCSRRRRVAASPGGHISAGSSPASSSAHC
jgi:membrane associated rhomboid family serine protease